MEDRAQAFGLGERAPFPRLELPLQVGSKPLEVADFASEGFDALTNEARNFSAWLGLSVESIEGRANELELEALSPGGDDQTEAFEIVSLVLPIAAFSRSGPGH